jgi:hypothetical protein
LHQKLFDPIQHCYDHEESHAALDGDFPIQHCEPSQRNYPGRLQTGRYFPSLALEGEGIWNLDYYNTVLGRLDLRIRKITGHDKVSTMCPAVHSPLDLD